MKRGYNYKDITNTKFGRWTAIKETSKGDKYHHSKWLFKCECGVSKILGKQTVTCGGSRSCGCLEKELTIKRNTTHGMAYTPTYRLWGRMIARCHNPKSKDYKHYGGRGITVSPEWRVFAKFVTDMGEVPEGLEIDRIDNNKGYQKGNCRYVTHIENCQNTRKNRVITFNEQTLSLSDWARKQGCNESRIRHRLNRGWSISDALLLPLQRRKSHTGRKIYQYTLIGGIEE